jgi:hypothetical protein
MRWRRGLARPISFWLGCCFEVSDVDQFVGVGVDYELVEEPLGWAHDPFRYGDFGAWSKEAEVGVEDDFFDYFKRRGVGFLFGEIEACDLQAVEEQAGAAGVDVVGCDAAEDIADGVLDGAAVFGIRQRKDFAVLLAGFELPIWDGAAGGVVKITEFFSAETGTGAAAPGGENVAALEAFFGVRCGGEIRL